MTKNDDRPPIPRMIIGPKTARHTAEWLIHQPMPLPADVEDATADLTRLDGQGVWRTRMPDAALRAYRPFGLPDELHAGAWYHPRDNKGGIWPAVIIQVPEEVAVWSEMMAQAKQHRARVIVVCDTAEQVAQSDRWIKRDLKQWRRRTLESVLLGGGS